MWCLSTFSGCGWVYGFTLTSIPPQMFPQICESWLKSYLMQVCKPCHYALVETVEPFKLHPMSMSYIYEVFECLLRLWMGIWLYTHTITTTLWINLLKWKNCVKVVLHSYLELSWRYGKMLGGLHRTHILPCSHQSVYSGNHYFCILPAKVCCETWGKVGGLHMIRVLWDWASISGVPTILQRTKTHMESMILYTVSPKNQFSTTVRPPNYIYLCSK